MHHSRPLPGITTSSRCKASVCAVGYLWVRGKCADVFKLAFLHIVPGDSVTSVPSDASRIIASERGKIPNGAERRSSAVTMDRNWTLADEVRD